MRTPRARSLADRLFQEIRRLQADLSVLARIDTDGLDLGPPHADYAVMELNARISYARGAFIRTLDRFPEVS